MIKAVLLDLDGTLIDTAPDMGAALNNLLVEENYAPLPLESGGLVLTRLGFADKVSEAEIEPLRQRFLQHYRAIVADDSRLFEGFEVVLSELESRRIAWGIVTNKPEWLTWPLLEQLELAQRAAVVIGGDTLAQRKPDPMPLRAAAERIGVNAADCVYLGDDERDVIAGNAAGMKTLIAAWGYIDPNSDFRDWGADDVIAQPGDLLQHPWMNEA